MCILYVVLCGVYMCDMCIGVYVELCVILSVVLCTVACGICVCEVCIWYYVMCVLHAVVCVYLLCTMVCVCVFCGFGPEDITSTSTEEIAYFQGQRSSWSPESCSEQPSQAECDLVE